MGLCGFFYLQLSLDTMVIFLRSLLGSAGNGSEGQDGMCSFYPQTVHLLACDTFLAKYCKESAHGMYFTKCSNIFFTIKL